MLYATAGTHVSVRLKTISVTGLIAGLVPLITGASLLTGAIAALIVLGVLDWLRVLFFLTPHTRRSEFAAFEAANAIMCASALAVGLCLHYAIKYLFG